MRISDWSSDVCSSDLLPYLRFLACYFSYVLNDMNDAIAQLTYARQLGYAGPQVTLLLADANIRLKKNSEGLALVSEAMKQQRAARSEEHTSELQSLMRISYAVFCLKKTTHTNNNNTLHNTHAHHTRQITK